MHVKVYGRIKIKIKVIMKQLICEFYRTGGRCLKDMGPTGSILIPVNQQAQHYTDDILVSENTLNISRYSLDNLIYCLILNDHVLLGNNEFISSIYL